MFTSEQQQQNSLLLHPYVSVFCFLFMLFCTIWFFLVPGFTRHQKKSLKLTASCISQSHKWDRSVKLPSLFSLSLVLQVFSFYKSIFYLCYMEVHIDFLFFFFIFPTGTRPQHDLENAIWQRRRKPAFLAVLIFVDNHYTFRTRITAAFQHFPHSERCPFFNLIWFRLHSVRLCVCYLH